MAVVNLWRGNHAIRVNVPRAPPPRCTSSLATSPGLSVRMEEELLGVQERLCASAEALDGSGCSFCLDRYERSGGNGYGITRVLEGGQLLEKAAANISVVSGRLSEERAHAMSTRGRAGVVAGAEYTAVALSIVFHTAHPLVPTLRGDVRVFEVGNVAWVGGGCDITPNYINTEDAVEFHGYWKNVLDGYGDSLYPRWKEWCDKYFYIPARAEHRGIGGIFFDDIAVDPITGQAIEDGMDAGKLLIDVAEGFLPSWEKIAKRRCREHFTEAQRHWQLLRRGRYIEFNLLYDRGVKFGLAGGRLESVLVSAPPLVAWDYNVMPKEGSEEEKLMHVLRNPIDWVST